MRRGSKNAWLFLLFILVGVVAGGFIGEYLGGIPGLGWLKYGQTFGLSSPLALDLGIIFLQFALSIKFSVSGIIGIIIAILLYKRI